MIRWFPSHEIHPASRNRPPTHPLSLLNPLFSLSGIILGSYFAARVPDFVLRPILAGTLVLVGARLVFQCPGSRIRPVQPEQLAWHESG